jgi:benzoate-CoA ligase family protein
MQDHTIKLNKEDKQTIIEYTPVFNAAVPFIDRHVEEGRTDKVVIRTTTGDQVTYGELAERVNCCGNVLLNLGTEKGDRILMVMKDSAEFFYVFWGAIKAGLIPVPVNTLLRADDYQNLISDSDCRVLVYSNEYSSEIESALHGLESKPGHSIPVEGSETSLQSLLADESVNLEPAPTCHTDECFWLYSSGSTGKPKAAVHLHRDMVVTSQYYGVETLGIREDDVCFSVAKLFFAYGLGNAMTFPLWIGASMVLDANRPTPVSAFAIIQDYQPTLFFGVPTLYAAQLRELQSTTTDLSSLRLCVSAGEALPANILNNWYEATSLPILDGIGSTEALHIFITNRADDIKSGSTGRLVPGYEAKIIDETGTDVDIGEQGQLLIKGDSIAKYYWNNPEKTAETMIDGWLKTGDTYYQDESGYFYYCGRNDDMMKVGGIWCSPFEIEARLSEHPKVLEAAVVARADENDLIKPAAYVILNNPADAKDSLYDELLEHCKSALARYKYPRWIYFVDDLPKTATGKIQRYKLR